MITMEGNPEGSIPELNRIKELIVQEWLDKYECGNLSRVLNQPFLTHWSNWVPKAYKLELEVALYKPCPVDIIFKTLLIETLEGFVFGNNQELRDVVFNSDNSGSVCGKIFKGGDPYYSCPDCGVDPTCVLCVACFKQSVHRNHNYKICTSTGGGCCDCGDIHSWKSDPHCDEHIKGLQNICESYKFPEDVIARTEILVSTILKYCTELFGIERRHVPYATVKVGNGEVNINCSTSNNYCTLLYNDEIHSVEQVADAVSSVSQCNVFEGLAIASYVDKAGRAILKNSTYMSCELVQSKLENALPATASPLKVRIYHWSLLTHQLFALNLLSWLEGFMKQTREFRDLFSKICLDTHSNLEEPCCSIAEAVLLSDTILWKAARQQWHHLFLAVILADHDNKIAFAQTFTNLYSNMLTNYIKDDHDNVFSVISLSVQLFTIPAIAKFLIESEDALSVLFDTFWMECVKLCSSTLRLHFNSTNSYLYFYRTLIILHDVEYILNVIPDEWSHDLRKNFIKGLIKLLKIFSLMQEMGAVTKQLHQHIEFEPEWRNEFKLQTRITPVITVMLKWCSNDQITTVKAFRVIMKALFKSYNSKLNNKDTKMVTFMGHKVKCYQFNPVSQPVSVHLPLLRFFAGLYLSVKKFGFDYNTPEFNALKKLTPMQLLEPVLRTNLMIAQVHAGMWKKNGHSLPNQIHLYRGSKCREEMYDKDIVLLQICASLMNSNDFLIAILYKFDLIDWFDPDQDIKPISFLEDTLKEMLTMNEEFWFLILTVVSERYTVGVGEVTYEECLKYEIIHRLFIKPRARSDLISYFPTKCDKSVVNRVIEEIATFEKVNISGRGTYSVKKELKNMYNVFFYHYSKEDKSRAEEEQNKTKEPGVFHPPPKLPEFTVPFQKVTCLLHCEVMFQLMTKVLKNSQSPPSILFSEGQLHMVLYLISYALQKEKCSCNACFIEESKKWNMECLLEQIVDCQHAEMCKDLIHWIIRKYKARSINSNETVSEGINIAPTSGECKDKDSKSVRSKLAAERQAAIMAQMKSLQQKFMKSNFSVLSDLNDDKEELESNDSDEISESPQVTTQEILTCIICQKSQAVSSKKSNLVFTAFIQKSVLLPDIHSKIWLCSRDHIDYPLHVSSCGHLMHAACWQVYVERNCQDEPQRPLQRVRSQVAFEGKHNEYLCPLCKTLSNTVLPVVPKFVCKEQNLSFPEWLLSMKNKYIDPLLAQTKEYCFTDLCHSCHLLSLQGSNAEDCSSEDSSTSCDNKQISSAVSDQPLTFDNESVDASPRSTCVSEDVMALIDKFTRSVSRISHTTFTNNSFLLTWQACAYTIQSLEKYLNFSNKSLFGDLTSRQEACLKNLVHVCVIISRIKYERLIQLQVFQKSIFGLLKTNVQTWMITFKYNCFDLFLMLLLSVPKPKNFSEGIYIDKNIFKIILFLKFAQTITLEPLLRSFIKLEEDVTTENTICLLNFIKYFKYCKGINTVEIWDLLKSASLPFLRSCAIFYYFLSGDEPPPILKEAGGDSFENILYFLGIPSGCNELLDCPSVHELFSGWGQMCRIEEFKEFILADNSLVVRKLVDLPYDYCDLIDRASSYFCPRKHKEDGSFPALCLICGELLCSNSYCCQKELNKTYVGPCTYHTSVCGGGCGIFLQIRECQLLFLSSDPIRGSFKSAPYFDEYGESDQGLRRGNPLFLNEECYKEVKKLWLLHGVHEEISRFLELSSGFSAADWGVF